MIIILRNINKFGFENSKVKLEKRVEGKQSSMSVQYNMCSLHKRVRPLYKPTNSMTMVYKKNTFLRNGGQHV